MKNYPLLILDDDAPILLALQETLMQEGYKCEGTTQAQEAMEMLKKQTFAVVLSDQRMAEMPGTQFLKNIKQIQPTCSRVLITGVLSCDMFLKAINDAEIFRCLAKPWTREQLIDVINEAYRSFEVKQSQIETINALLEANRKLLDENIQLQNQQKNGYK